MVMVSWSAMVVSDMYETLIYKCNRFLVPHMGTFIDQIKANKTTAAAAATAVALGTTNTNLAATDASLAVVEGNVTSLEADLLSVPIIKVRVASTVNGVLATAFAAGQTVDGIELAEGDLILLKSQTAASENGVYTVSAEGAPVRAAEAATVARIRGTFVVVTDGTVGSYKLYLMQVAADAVLDTGDITVTACTFA